MDMMTPAELAILEAQHAVDGAGCDPRLTEAGTLLEQARGKVADYVDGVNAAPWTDEQREALLKVFDALRDAIDAAPIEKKIEVLWVLSRKEPR